MSLFVLSQIVPSCSVQPTVKYVVCIQGLALTLDINLNYNSAVLLTRAVWQVLTMYALFGT